MWKLILGLLVFIFSIVSCQKAQLLGEYYLGNLKYENPYQGNETLVFQTSNNNSLTFPCQGRYSITNNSKPGHNSNDYYLWEADYTNFTELNGDYHFIIDMRIDKESASMGIRISDYITDTDTSIYIRAVSSFPLPLDNENLYEGQIGLVVNATC